MSVLDPWQDQLVRVVRAVIDLRERGAKKVMCANRNPALRQREIYVRGRMGSRDCLR